jgi:hypothetical protein
MIIKSFKEFINESFGRKYGLSVTTVNKIGEKFRDNYSFNSIEDARKFMVKWLENHLGGFIEYFDICSGSNYSDPECVEVWGGVGGYFYNAINSSYKNHQQFTQREIHKIKRSEVDINTFFEK